MQDLSSTTVATDRLLNYKDYGDKRVPKSKQHGMDEKNKGKCEKQAKYGRVHGYRKHRSDRQTVFQSSDNSRKFKVISFMMIHTQ